MSTNGRKSAVVTQGLGAAIAQYLAADRFNALINSASQSKFLRPAAAIIAAVVFLLDALTSLDIAIAVLYVLVVLLSLNFATQTGLILIGAGCIGLTVLGFMISHGEGLPALEGSMGRCFVSLAAIGITTFLAFRVKAAIGVLAESEQRYRTIFLATGVGILQMDFTGLKDAIDKLKVDGVRDIDHAQTLDPGFLYKVSKTIKLINANDTALTMFNVARYRRAWRPFCPNLLQRIWTSLETPCGDLVRQVEL